jgi:hypothetical protein
MRHAREVAAAATVMLWYDVMVMSRVGHHLVTFFAALSVFVTVLFCYRWISAPDDGLPLTVLVVLAASLLALVAVAIAIDQPWRRLPDARREDWPFYVGAGVGVVLGLLIMLVPPWITTSNHTSWISMIGQLLMTFSCYVAIIPGHKRRKRRGAGCCPECGYNLRASPERCPECGSPAK